MDELQGISWHDGRVRILDQTRLPEELVALEISDYQGIIRAITGMNVRGAPAIGIAAAYGIVLAVWSLEEADRPAFLQRVNQASEALARSRPTARNLFWALERMRAALMKLLSRPLREIKLALLEEAQRLHADDIERCRAIGRFGAALLPQTTSIMTHCNAGAFATGGFGTALGVIRTAVSQGKKVQVYACETRPLLQGSRITAWELAEEEIPVTVLCDSMAAYAMARGLVQMVIVGPTASPAMATPPTRSAPMDWPSSPAITASPFMWPPPSPPSTWRSAAAITSPSNSAPPPRWSCAGACEQSPRACRCSTPLLMSPPPSSSTPLSQKRGSSGRHLRKV